MATYTAGDQINRALRLLGVLAEGETPSASESADALMALNQMLDSWSTERLAVYSTSDQEFTWPANTVSRTLGPSGDFVGSRPILVDDSTYFVVNGISYEVTLINQEQYDAIPVKTVSSPYPRLLFVNNSYPDIEVFLYPVPNTDATWHFISVTPLSEPASLDTDLAFPPGYMRAFAYNLAMEIAPEFGIDPPAQVKKIAITSKRDLKRINNPNDVMFMPAALLPYPLGGGNIYTGWY